MGENFYFFWTDTLPRDAEGIQDLAYRVILVLACHLESQVLQERNSKSRIVAHPIVDHPNPDVVSVASVLAVPQVQLRSHPQLAAHACQLRTAQLLPPRYDSRPNLSTKPGGFANRCHPIADWSNWGCSRSSR